MSDNWLIRLKVFTNPIIYSLFSNFVIVSCLNFNHVFQIIQITSIELGVGRLPTSITTCELVMDINPGATGAFGLYSNSMIIKL